MIHSHRGSFDDSAAAAAKVKDLRVRVEIVASGLTQVLDVLRDRLPGRDVSGLVKRSPTRKRSFAGDRLWSRLATCSPIPERCQRQSALEPNVHGGRSGHGYWLELKKVRRNPITPLSFHQNQSHSGTIAFVAVLCELEGCLLVFLDIGCRSARRLVSCMRNANWQFSFGLRVCRMRATGLRWLPEESR